MTWPFSGTIFINNPVFYDANQPPTSKKSMAGSWFDQESLLCRPGQVFVRFDTFWGDLPMGYMVLSSP